MNAAQILAARFPGAHISTGTSSALATLNTGGSVLLQELRPGWLAALLTPTNEHLTGAVEADPAAALARMARQALTIVAEAA